MKFMDAVCQVLGIYKYVIVYVLLCLEIRTSLETCKSLTLDIFFNQLKHGIKNAWQK